MVVVSSLHRATPSAKKPGQFAATKGVFFAIEEDRTHPPLLGQTQWRELHVVAFCGSFFQDGNEMTLGGFAWSAVVLLLCCGISRTQILRPQFVRDLSTNTIPDIASEYVAMYGLRLVLDSATAKQTVK